MEEAFESFVLDVAWDRESSSSPVMPPLVGPFQTREEADKWAALNITGNASWAVLPLSFPYLVARGLAEAWVPIRRKVTR